MTDNKGLTCHHDMINVLFVINPDQVISLSLSWNIYYRIICFSWFVIRDYNFFSLCFKFDIVQTNWCAFKGLITWKVIHFHTFILFDTLYILGHLFSFLAHHFKFANSLYYWYTLHFRKTLYCSRILMIYESIFRWIDSYLKLATFHNIHVMDWIALFEYVLAILNFLTLH